MRTLARYALDAKVLPLVTETLPLVECVRHDLLVCFRRCCERKHGRRGPQPFLSETLSGKNAEGEPLTGHEHAYYLPTDDDGDGRIDHVVISAARGFDEDELPALDALRTVNFNSP